LVAAVSSSSEAGKADVGGRVEEEEEEEEEEARGVRLGTGGVEPPRREWHWWRRSWTRDWDD
jgi:hypothetical protein